MSYKKTIGTTLPVEEISLLRQHADALNDTTSGLVRTILMHAAQKLRGKYTPQVPPKRSGDGTESFTVLLPPDQIQAMQLVARAHGVSLQKLTHIAVMHYGATVPAPSDTEE